MVSFPPCKINLGLHIIDKRPDGYHNLITCFYPVPWTDILEVIIADTFSFTCSGNPIPGIAEENLCVKAYALLKEDFRLAPVKIHLHKIIPTGAGLGGGSADGAYTLRSLNTIFKLELSQERLMAYAALLGSDCSFFIQDESMLATGRGEILSGIQVNLSNKYIVLVKPGIHVSTAEAYGGIHPRQPLQSIAQLVSDGIETWRLFLKNDFEESVFKKYPAIEDIKEKLYSLGALYASMSGSGAAVYGIFEAEVNLASQFPGATVWSAPIP
ncbi:MAG: 4-(cytidine 5'-diphospho)-2-C-methyl-D-erythritol kinase [Cyclobacteriaceae bacterium]|nr:4-(cytidine 5'-diphospho)-2-C-methyl-D-erythritol kinase [Cyclobacteriaceae bacterium]MDH4296636.1 4-(cytidine 5'-diphospho)-2-C-methyl-D-erythritol kinase [Cyclobacteriaceae bacterium]MDH5249549.1 4-(cytidine 5'-diphospho)-2-C-methyl-D-erythritol kinase [Cyclobacteriaceae bacterium]